MTEQVQWAIVELMGHQKIAGRYSEHGTMYRIDVPGNEPGEFLFTRLYSPAAIYSITFVDEQAAILAAKALQPQAITIWEVSLELKRLASPATPETIFDAEYPPDDYEVEEVDF